MIRGEKVLLRAIEPSDADNYFRWINDEETNFWRGLYHPTSAREAKDWIDELKTSTPDTLSLAVDLQDGTKVGFIGLRGICARSRRAEVWIYLGAKEHWGKGIGTDALKALCRYAFEEMNLYRIWLECDPEYKSALQSYLNVGFVQEGTLRKGYFRRGAFRDTAIMGLLRDDKHDVSEKERKP